MSQENLLALLSEPFDSSEVRFKAQSVKNNRALAVAYIDARLVQERLDKVIGVGAWTTEYVVLSDKSVECRLSLWIDDRWVVKADVGSASEQPDAGDRMKAAYSDALKRAAVQFGVGRYLYRLPAQWVDYDPIRKRFTRSPFIPAPVRPTPVKYQVAGAPAAMDAAPGRPSAVFTMLAELLNQAADQAELADAWKVINQNKAKLTARELADLAALKDRRKAELAEPPRERQPGEDDDAPF